MYMRLVVGRDNLQSGVLRTELSTTDVVLSAILRRFDAAAISLPLDVLRQALLVRERLLHDLHPRKMEQLVQSVFRDFFHCGVEHCGRTGDGGIDLALVLSDQPAIV